MSGDVHVLPGVIINRPSEKQPVGVVVDLLEKLLERARLGEIQAIGVASVENQVYTNFQFAGISSHLLTAAVSDLLFEVLLNRSKERRSGSS